MATGFTTDEQLKISEYCDISSIELTQYLSAYDNEITSDTEARVRTHLDTLETLDTDFTNIHPNQQNYGAEIKYNDRKNELKQKIRRLLYLPTTGGSGTGARLQRA